MFGEWPRTAIEAVAISALKQTNPGALVWATGEEVERILDGGSLRIVR